MTKSITPPAPLLEHEHTPPAQFVDAWRQLREDNELACYCADNVVNGEPCPHCVIASVMDAVRIQQPEFVSLCEQLRLTPSQQSAVDADLKVVLDAATQTFELNLENGWYGDPKQGLADRSYAMDVLTLNRVQQRLLDPLNVPPPLIIETEAQIVKKTAPTFDPVPMATEFDDLVINTIHGEGATVWNVQTAEQDTLASFSTKGGFSRDDAARFVAADMINRAEGHVEQCPLCGLEEGLACFPDSTSRCPGCGFAQLESKPELSSHADSGTSR